MKKTGTPAAAARGQRGMTLVVALIMLTLLGLLAAWGVRSGMANVRVVGNMQARQAALTGAQAALESTISSSTFVQQPAAVAANAIPVDVDGDGVADVTAQLVPAPACQRMRTVKMAELDPTSPQDIPCLRSSSSGNSGIESESISAGDSLCADSLWNVRAVATEPTTGASVVVNQGVDVRGLVTDAQNGCP
jgi:Tfp pilus assembly protein PilX